MDNKNSKSLKETKRQYIGFIKSVREKSFGRIVKNSFPPVRFFYHSNTEKKQITDHWDLV